jgi:hypothetical protein
MMEEERAQTQLLLRGALLKAARGLIELLDSTDPRVRLTAIMKLLESYHLLGKDNVEPPKPEPNPEKRRADAMAQIISMILIKKWKYDATKLPGLEEMIAEVRRVIAEDLPDTEPTS